MKVEHGFEIILNLFLIIRGIYPYWKEVIMIKNLENLIIFLSFSPYFEYWLPGIENKSLKLGISSQKLITNEKKFYQLPLKTYILIFDDS